MINSHLKICFIFPVMVLCGCGVKGKPLPPLIPPPIGRGEPVYSGATKKKKTIKNRYNYKLEEGDDSDTDPSAGK